jgi:hypothetical protein
MTIIIPTPSEALHLIDCGLEPDYTGISLSPHSADEILTDLLSAAVDIVEFTNHVHQPDFFFGVLADVDYYENTENAYAADIAVIIAELIGSHLETVETLDQGDEPIAHMIARSVRLAIIGTQYEVSISALAAVAEHEPEISLFGEFDDDELAGVALGIALFISNLIASHFAPGDDLDENGQGFDAYVEAINA